MAIREREWTWKGKARSAWVCDYFDAKGKRRLKTFMTKRAAEDWAAETRVQLKRGMHIADCESVTSRKRGSCGYGPVRSRVSPVYETEPRALTASH